MMRAKITRTWTADEVAKLSALLDTGASAIRAAAALKRSIISVQGKARDLGRPFPHKRAIKRARLAKEVIARSQEQPSSG